MVNGCQEMSHSMVPSCMKYVGLILRDRGEMLKLLFRGLSRFGKGWIALIATLTDGINVIYMRQ